MASRRARLVIMQDKPDDFFIVPDDLADTAFHLTTQPPIRMVIRSRSASVQGEPVALRRVQSSVERAACNTSVTFSTGSTFGHMRAILPSRPIRNVTRAAMPGSLFGTP
jgi:hypothetical protein